MDRERSAGELDFINQNARRLMVKLAEQAVLSGGPLQDMTLADIGSAYRDHMLQKGWLTKREPRTLTAAGWGVAAAFLKR